MSSENLNSLLDLLLLHTALSFLYGNEIPMRKRTPGREIVNIDTAAVTTSSEMDIPNGEGFAYAPKVFTNPNYVATLPQTETECSDLEVVQNNFVGEYCEKCVKKHKRCWCNRLDWDVDPMEVEPPNSVYY